MKNILLVGLTTIIAALSSCAPSGPDPSKQPLPAGTIQIGSLANRKLMMDAALGAVAKLAAQGNPNTGRNLDFVPYVVSMPTGTPGSRKWTERWYFHIEGKKVPVTFDFRETGMGSASWTIRN